MALTVAPGIPTLALRRTVEHFGSHTYVGAVAKQSQSIVERTDNILLRRIITIPDAENLSEDVIRAVCASIQ